ncbi:MAG: hypothetical protein WBD47_21430 [Phormidesmis sp.]
MPKKNSRKRAAGIKQMKLVAIKQECYAISGAATTSELKQKYVTLSKNRDFRRRKTWEYVLKRLRCDGEWLGISVADLESIAEERRKVENPGLRKLVFSPERVGMDQAAENDD